jgi:ATP-binding cassette, sub-family E, member 1
MCIKKCPFKAISIINLPTNLSKEISHRYGVNSFKLHRLPVPRSGEVLGLVGTNGIGKSTALNILSGKIQPNLGHFDDPPDWKTIFKHFRGSELQSYFTKLTQNEMKALIKIQYVDDYKIKKETQNIVGVKLETLDNAGRKESVIEKLNLENILDRQVKDLSGGELQRYFIAKVYVQKADIYMFDEPSSYLDVKQRLRAARAIRELNAHDNFIICVEHDLSILDYLSDYVCCLYGTPGVYGVVTMPSSVREGINIFLAGFIPSENMRFRDTELSFKVSEDKKDEVEDETAIQKAQIYTYPKMTKTLGSFKLQVEEGKFTNSEIVVMLGENGTGKSTLIHILAGILKPDDEDAKLPPLVISIKPQKIAPKFQGSVRSLLEIKLGDNWNDPVFNTEVLKPLSIEPIIDNEVQTLSGGEIQRVALTLALGRKCDVFLIDEPSAYLDSEQRLIAAKVIKRWVMSTKKSAFIVEHDFIMASYLADKVIVFDGTPAQETFCSSPEGLVSGMNRFLKMLEITFRRDPANYRPRINKHLSQKDQEQKASG